MDLQVLDSVKYVEIRINSPIDAKSSVELEDELERIIYFHNDKDIILNLSGVKYMSSSGLRIFIALKNNMIETNQKLKLVGLTEAVHKIFEITRVKELFEIFSSIEEAIKSYQS